MVRISMIVVAVVILTACTNGANHHDEPSAAQQQESRDQTQASQQNPVHDAEVVHASEGQITITANEYVFTPNRIRATPGEVISLEVRNTGDRLHAIEFHLGEGQELERTIDPGSSITMEFQAPAQTGSFEFYCPIGDHRDKGMTGTLVVAPESPGEQESPNVTNR